MAVFEFVSFGASGEGHDLDAETDAKDWNFFSVSFFDGFLSRFGFYWIARAVGDEDAVEFEVVVENVVVPRYADYGDVPFEEAADDVVLGAAVDHDDGFAAAFVNNGFFN